VAVSQLRLVDAALRNARNQLHRYCFADTKPLFTSL
jgi:hypothetical protein